MLHLPHGGLQPGRHGGSGKHHPGHTGSFQQRLVHRVQSLQLLLDELAETVGHASGDRLDPTRECHGSRPLPQDPTAHRLVHHRDDKQRIALGPLLE